MKLLKYIGIPVWVLFAPLWVFADIGDDAAFIARWVSGEIANITAFNASATPQHNGDVRSLLGIELGVSAGASKSDVDLGEFGSLPFTEINPSAFDMASDLLVPMATLHAKIGLIWGLDLGAKYGRFSDDSSDGSARNKIDNQVFGVELRKRLMGEGVAGAVIPDVSIALSYDQANGDLRRTNRYNGAINSGTLSADTRLDSDWTTGAVSARVVASKRLLFLTPFIGLGVSHLTGSAHTTVSVNGTSTLGPVAESERASADADGNVVHLTGGVDLAFFPTLKINLGGLWAEDHSAASVGLKFAFR